MKILLTFLLPGLALALGAGCGNTINLKPAATPIHSGESTTVTITLTNDQGAAPRLGQSVDVWVNNASALVCSNGTGAIALTVNNGTAAETMTAKPVDRNTAVEVKGEWNTSAIWDPTGVTTVTVLPPRATATAGQELLRVSPSVPDATTYRYDVESLTPTNPPQAGSGTTAFSFTFQVPVTLRVISAAGSIGSLTATAATVPPTATNAGPSTGWVVSAGAPMEQLTVEATAADANLGGTVTVSGTIGGQTITVTATGPQP